MISKMSEGPQTSETLISRNYKNEKIQDASQMISKMSEGPQTSETLISRNPKYDKGKDTGKIKKIRDASQMISDELCEIRALLSIRQSLKFFFFNNKYIHILIQQVLQSMGFLPCTRRRRPKQQCTSSCFRLCVCIRCPWSLVGLSP